ncbi:glycosyltransferase family 2 protein [Vibrio mimicus]|uniref:Glycosyltransferase 2-like domain-containing protein n=1 Tax=Vibrio mimicus VM603 TaxID=671074 RepID=D2YGE5_VIBMI|nr:glycosyltransferase family A protein [Vibrio mimicus]EEW06182.1 conserved hypothetical protein [Vibrio mimicus VM603]
MRSYNLPLVSVIIPCFNGEEYICDSVDSVLGQSYDNIEIIVVDDGSTDRTIELIKEKYHALDGFRLVQLASNCGAAVARNKGVSEARGEYVCFLDADDLAVRHRIECQLKKLLDTESNICVSPLKNFGLSKNHVNWISLNQEGLKKISLLKCPFPQPSVFGERWVFQSNPYLAGCYAEDYELWSRLLFKYKFCVVDEPLILGRNHSGSASRSHKEKIESQTHEIRVSSIKNYGLRLSNSELEVLRSCYTNKFVSHDRLVSFSHLLSFLLSEGYSDKFISNQYNDQFYWVLRQQCNYDIFGVYRRLRFSKGFRWFGLGKEVKLLLNCIVNFFLR